MSLAKEMQDVATELLNEFDEDKKRMTLVKPAGEPVWDPVLAEMVPQASSNFDLVGVTVSFSAAQVNNTTIQSGDVMVYAVAQDNLDVSLQDKIIIDGVNWSIVDTPIVNYTGLTLMYKIHCRK